MTARRWALALLAVATLTACAPIDPPTGADRAADVRQQQEAERVWDACRVSATEQDCLDRGLTPP